MKRFRIDLPALTCEVYFVITMGPSCTFDGWNWKISDKTGKTGTLGRCSGGLATSAGARGACIEELVKLKILQPHEAENLQWSESP